jgi:hypothetical protein
MGLAVRLLHHLRRRHFLSPLCVSSISSPLQSSSVQARITAGPFPHEHLLGGIPSRSFSWFSNSGNSGDNELSPHRRYEILESGIEQDNSVTEATLIENDSGGEVVSEASIWDYPIEMVTGFLDGYHDLTGFPW